MSLDLRRAALHLCLSLVACNGAWALGWLSTAQLRGSLPAGDPTALASPIGRDSEPGEVGPAARHPLDLRGRARVNAAGRCRVHDAELFPVLVPIEYGLRGLIPGEGEWREANCPNAEPDVSGGCEPGPDREAIVLHCGECLRARARPHDYHHGHAAGFGARPN